MRNKQNMIVCIGVALVFMLMFAGNAAAESGGGGGPSCAIILSPDTAKNIVGTQHTVIATATGGGSILVSNGIGIYEGIAVRFEVIDGPHKGKTGTNVTNANGIATWSYTGTTAGVDQIQADSDESFPSNIVTKEWIATASLPPVADANGPYVGDLCSPITLDASGSYDPDYPLGSIVSWEWDLDNDGEFDDASGEFVGWTWGSAGDKVVGLRVTDDFGAVDICYAQVRVNECEEIPEFPTIAVPIAAILGLAFIFQRRKN